MTLILDLFHILVIFNLFIGNHNIINCSLVLLISAVINVLVNLRFKFLTYLDFWGDYWYLFSLLLSREKLANLLFMVYFHFLGGSWIIFLFDGLKLSLRLWFNRCDFFLLYFLCRGLLFFHLLISTSFTSWRLSIDLYLVLILILIIHFYIRIQFIILLENTVIQQNTCNI